MIIILSGWFYGLSSIGFHREPRSSDQTNASHGRLKWKGESSVELLQTGYETY